jgi:hypothetical protein
MSDSAEVRFLKRLVGNWNIQPDLDVLRTNGLPFIPATAREALSPKGGDLDANDLGSLVADEIYENRLILNGSFLQTSFMGTLHGTSFGWVIIMGVDRASNQFTEFILDSHGGAKFWKTARYHVGDDSLRLEFESGDSRITHDFSVDGDSTYAHRMTKIDPHGEEIAIKAGSFTKRS